MVKGATIANILLENVAITDNVANTGSLARILDGALISDVNIKRYDRFNTKQLVA